MKSQYYNFKNKAILLRKSGKTYGEIKNILGQDIPKSTLSIWFKKIILTKEQQNNIKKNIKNNIHQAQIKALVINKKKRERYLISVNKRIKHLKDIIKNKDVAKIAIAMLYLGEGSKTRRGSLMFGNSDAKIIALFFRLLRYCYDINEKKFRCTLQCRADQNIIELEKFWSKITKIPLCQFYKARIDSRTIGKKSKKLDYKGVCRVDYFSADIFNEIIKIIKIIVK